MKIEGEGLRSSAGVLASGWMVSVRSACWVSGGRPARVRESVSGCRCMLSSLL